MKKLLGISLIAALAVSPMMAFAEGEIKADTYQTAAILPGGQTNDAQNPDNVPVAAQSALYAGKEISAADAEHVATGAYVKGAYNAAIAAINKTATDLKEGVVNTVKSATVEAVTDVTVTGGGVSAYTDWADETATGIATLGGDASVTVTKGRQNVMIAQEVAQSGDDKGKVTGPEYHQSAATTVTTNYNLNNPDTVPGSSPYSDTAGVSHTISGTYKATDCPTGTTWNSTSNSCVENNNG